MNWKVVHEQIKGSSPWKELNIMRNIMCNRSQLIARSVLFVTAAPLAISAYSLSLASTSPNTTPPASVTLIGVVRDFKEKTVAGGHPDFEVTPSGGFGHYCDNLQPTLGADGKPVFKGGGFKVKTQWKNSAGKNICNRLYNQSLGDVRARRNPAPPPAASPARPPSTSGSTTTWPSMSPPRCR